MITLYHGSNKIDNAMMQFKVNCILQGQATETGNYKKGNKCADKIFRAVEFLRSNKKLDLLKPFLFEKDENLRCWTARALIHLYTNLCLKVLTDIKNNSQGINSLNAEMTISEFKKGHI